MGSGPWGLLQFGGRGGEQDPLRKRRQNDHRTQHHFFPIPWNSPRLARVSEAYASLAMWKIHLCFQYGWLYEIKSKLQLVVA